MKFLAFDGELFDDINECKEHEAKKIKLREEKESRLKEINELKKKIEELQKKFEEDYREDVLPIEDFFFKF